MYVRVRVVASLERLFDAPALWSGEQDSLPTIGGSYDYLNDQYRVVKVMLDVDPDYGSRQRGPVVFVLKIEPSRMLIDDPRRSLLNVSFLANISGGLRNCIERADLARRDRHSEVYRRHVEEFLFLSHAASGLLGTGHIEKVSPTLPYLLVFGATKLSTRFLRDGFIDSSFAVQVTPVPSLHALRWTLDRLDTTRPTVMIITEPMTLRAGLTAVSIIRKHPSAQGCPVVVLTQPGRASEAILAMGAGATATATFPETLGDYTNLVAQLRAILAQPWQADSPSENHEKMN